MYLATLDMIACNALGFPPLAPTGILLTAARMKRTTLSDHMFAHTIAARDDNTFQSKAIGNFQKVCYDLMTFTDIPAQRKLKLINLESATCL